MAQFTFQGDEMQTVGELPVAGDTAPGFKLTAADLSDKSLQDFAGRKKLLNIFPSIDTAVCALSVKRFNNHAQQHEDTAMLMISVDTPFALKRYCDEHELEHVVPLSMLRDKSFAQDYGVLIEAGPLAGVSARAVVVLDEDDNVLHSELVSELTHEPDYQAAIDAL